jgi:hypothetical protein
LPLRIRTIWREDHSISDNYSAFVVNLTNSSRYIAENRLDILNTVIGPTNYFENWTCNPLWTM